MTTENTDAAVRILTKTIRRLAAQLAEADESIRYAEGKRKGAEDELTAVRETLTPRPVVNISTSGNWVYKPQETTLDLAAKRMAELSKLRGELAEERKASHSIALSVAAEANERMRSRIDDALAALEGTGSAMARAHTARRILRGEA